MSSERAQAGVGSAHLADLDEDGPYTIHGVALGAGDVTLGSSGVKKVWPGDELKKAASSLEGKPLVRDHENSTKGTVGEVTKASYRENVGVLYEAEIAPHYEELAKDIASGIMDVSARAFHAPTEELEDDEELGAKRVEDIHFDNLAVVPQGAAPSNSAQIGEAAAMAQAPDGGSIAVMSQGSERLAQAELQDEFDYESSDEEEMMAGTLTFYGPVSAMVDDDEIEDLLDDLNEHGALTSVVVGDDDDQKLVSIVDTSDVDSIDGLNDHIKSTLEDSPFEVYDGYNWLREVARGEYLEDGKPEFEADEEQLRSFDELKSVAGVTFDGTKSGDLDESEIPDDDYESHYLFPADTKSDSSYPVVDADGNLRKGNVESAWELGARGGVSESELKSKLESLNDEFDNPPIDPEKFNEDEEESEDHEEQDTNRTIEVAELKLGDDPDTASTGGSAALDVYQPQ